MNTFLHLDAFAESMGYTCNVLCVHLYPLFPNVQRNTPHVSQDLKAAAGLYLFCPSADRSLYSCQHHVK